MWGKPPFSIADNYAIGVRNMATARGWYQEKLGLHEARNNRQDDSGRPFVDLHISDHDGFISLVELVPGAPADKQHVIFFAQNLEKTRQWLVGRGVTTLPITTDLGGNRLLVFQDLDGNMIEVCIEPA